MKNQLEIINEKKREILKKAGIGIVGFGTLYMMPSVLASTTFRDNGIPVFRADDSKITSFVDLNVEKSLDVDGGNIRALSTKTIDYTILLTDYTIIADASSNSVTITLPTSAKQGQIFNIFCVNSTFNCIVARNGNNINGDAVDRTLVVNQCETYQFDNTSKWVII